MNVFLRELRANRGSTLTWTMALAGILMLFMAMYPTFTADVEVTRQVLEQFPEAVRNALGITLSTFFTVNGFFGYLLNFTILAGAIQAMNLGTGIIAKETAGKTADFLLSKPVTRSRVMSAKLAAAFALLAATNVVFITAAYLVARVLSEDDFAAGTLLLMASTLFLVQLFFVALGALVAVAVPRIKSVVAVTLPTVFAFFIVGMVGDVVANEDVRFISPFKFFAPDRVIADGRLEGATLLLDLAFVALAITLSYVIFVRKDMRSSV